MPPADHHHPVGKALRQPKFLYGNLNPPEPRVPAREDFNRAICIEMVDLYYNLAYRPEPRGPQGEMMFSHVMLGSNDIERSKRFYDAVLGTIGASTPVRSKATSGHTQLFYQHDGSCFCISEPINGESATLANGGTIGFKCSSVEQVQTFHDTALAQGGQSCEDPPGLREGGMGAMHLAYVRDPDGNKLCAIYRL